jgi:protein-arginine kinase activator protein McsA
MKKAVEDMAFERAADLRDRIRELRRKAVFDF